MLPLFATLWLQTPNLSVETPHQTSQASIPSLSTGSRGHIVAQASRQDNLTPASRQGVEFRALPGRLDTVPVFNSNSPEVVRRSGILLSTFPPRGKRYPNAHLNYTFNGRFDIFAHHVAKTNRPEDTPTFYKGILLYNPSSKRLAIKVLQSATFLGNPDAPYIALPPQVSNDLGKVFSGPGGRVVDQILRGRRQTHWPPVIYLRPGQSKMLINLPIPVPSLSTSKKPVRGPKAKKSTALATTLLRKTAPSSNTRSTLAHLQSDGPVYVASMAMLAPLNADGTEKIPTKKDWEALLLNGALLSPRDKPPSPLNQQATPFFYGRVAGVSRGSRWKAQLTDDATSQQLTIPKPGRSFAYGLSTLQRGTFGTAQVQSAPMLVRYPDTAYLSHGNYGVHYDLTLPLFNPTQQARRVDIAIQTPLKHDRKEAGLNFWRSKSAPVFFRGTVRVRYKDDEGNSQLRYFHLVQKQGQKSQSLVTLKLKPEERRLVTVDYVYPPDATPPQVLTVKTDLFFGSRSK
ncbi:DUF3370 domain-containing protein [Acaryochloris sp. IP29b_bin.148]|uniref:DUF3370 domain-containing protein n=1 Tax=Acaryochloris sp. IP29b_bin.148 TaxID=2969218 RepID=UPI0026110E46|nr:DUF3370 domain-containing protein [Acaryochloris sp. IP29b_bin.148]